MSTLSIADYIKRQTDGKVRIRGLKYFYGNKIISSEIDKTEGKAIYIIRGNAGRHIVSINDFNNGISTSCSCHYGPGPVCKHQIAALYHLQNYLNPGLTSSAPGSPASAPARADSKRNTGTPYYISNYLKLQPLEVHSHCCSVSYDNSKIELISQDALTKRAVFQVTGYYHPLTVNISVHPEYGLGFTCNCTNNVLKLCQHESSVLIRIAVKNKLSDFLSRFQPEHLENTKDRILAEFGLPPGIPFDDYFKLQYTPEGLFLHKQNKGIGLERIKAYRTSSDVAWVSAFSELAKHSLANLPPVTGNDPNANIETRVMGYVLIPGHLSSQSGTTDPSLIPICGKLMRNGQTLGTPIREFEHADGTSTIKLTEEDRKLVSLAADLNREKARLHLRASGLSFADSEIQEFEMQKYYLEILRQIVPLLEKQRFVYMPSRAYHSPSGSVRKSDLLEIKVSSEPIRPYFDLYEKDSTIVLQARSLETNQHFYQPFLFTVLNNTYCLNNSVGESQSLRLFKNNPIVKVVGDDFDNFFEDIVKPIAQKFPVMIAKLQKIKTTIVKLLPTEKRIYISEVGGFILFKPFVMYVGDKLIETLNKAISIEKKSNTITTFERDAVYEDSFIAFLKTLHPRFAGQFRSDFFHLTTDEMVSNNWFFSAFYSMKEAGINVFGYNQLKSFNYSPYRAKVTVQLKSGVDWFDVEVQLSYGETKVSLKDIRTAILRNEQYIKLADGTTGILPEEWFGKFSKYFQHGEISENKIQISKLRFSIIDELFDTIDNTEIFKELAEKKQMLRSFKEIKSVKTPAGIKAKLRDYQKEGLNWLNFLHQFKWGGILADDMGLGKTLQALSFLVHISKKAKNASLIVMPTSLMFNWENEIKKFAPHIKAMFYHGNDRIKDHSAFRKNDLVFTTYGLMSRDIEVLKEYTFHYIILDESQAIKNLSSQRFKAACLLRSDYRLALTGTPIENNTFDLFSQMTFLNPGFLGNASSFKENFSNPIDRDRSEQHSVELHKLIKPFILRRTKQQVERDLPDKTEDILYCTMDAQQQKVYDAFRNKYRNYLMNKIEEEGLAKSKIYVLEGLLKLRQICDSPQLLSDEVDYGNESVKIKELMRHISEKTGKHKLLVFSQFVKMLHLIKTQLDKTGIPYEYLDGRNKIEQRKESVNRFQNDENCRIFLISLKAGGTGLTLTAADYVYIVDPWWNPAVENQAIDRCHRIGQDKKVIAYRMICKNTVEEKILNYQTRKKQISSELIRTDESFMKTISKSDIEKLFE